MDSYVLLNMSDIPEIDILTILAYPNWFFLKVNINLHAIERETSDIRPILREAYLILKNVTPSSAAFLATSAAPSITLGFDVFVQLVIAAITTLPCLSSAGCPWKENFATFSCASFGTANPCIGIGIS
nr:hypothetical protein ALC57_05748 [Ipomoea batatas]